MKQQINIYSIYNTDNRNEEFTPLIEQITAQGFGKFEEGKYFIIQSELQFQGNTKTEKLFNFLQNMSSQKGHNFTMFQLFKS